MTKAEAKTEHHDPALKTAGWDSSIRREYRTKPGRGQNAQWRKTEKWQLGNTQ